MLLILIVLFILISAFLTFSYFFTKYIQSYLISKSKVTIKPINYQIPTIKYKISKNIIPNKYDVIIIGAGVAGSTMAYSLAKQNKKILCIDRALGDRIDKTRIIGELLQPIGVIRLKNMGLGNIFNEIESVRIKKYQMHNQNEYIDIDYPKSNKSKLFGYGFHNYKLIENIREKLLALENVTLLEGNVTNMIYNKNNRVKGVIYNNYKEKDLKVNSDLVIVADGCFSLFRKKKEKKSIKVLGYFLGFILKNVDDEHNTANVIYGHDQPILIYPINKDEYRILIHLEKLMPKKLISDYLYNNVYHQIPKKFQKSFSDAVKLKQFKAMPSQVMASLYTEINGSIFIGDSHNMRHPISGGGMSVALTDVSILSNLLYGLNTFSCEKSIDEITKIYHRKRKIENMTLNTIASCIFLTINLTNIDLTNAFFEYLNSEDYKKIGAMRLLSGLSNSEYELLFHYFNVVLEKSSRLFKERSWIYKYIRIYKLWRSSINIAYPFVISESNNMLTICLIHVLRYLFILKI